jgi:NAD(P)-dependent dehydrogenase (short-subunit alcohol dehydrogenase family)
MPSASAYSVSKAGLEMLTLTLAKECGGTGVTVNAVRPGVVETPMQEYMRALPRDLVGEEFHSRFHGLHERGELLDPALPARLVVRLVQTDRSGEVVDTRERSGQELLRG